VLNAAEREGRAPALPKGSRPDTANASRRYGECKRKGTEPGHQRIWTSGRSVRLPFAPLCSVPAGPGASVLIPPFPQGAGMAPSRLRSLRKLALSHPGPATLHALCPVPTSLSGSSSVSLPSLMPWCMRAAGGCRPHTRFPCSGPPLTLSSIGSYRRRDDSEGAAKSLTRLTFITRTGERISPSMGAPRGCDWQHARTWSSKTSISGSHMRSRVTGRNDSSCKSQ